MKISKKSSWMESGSNIVMIQDIDGNQMIIIFKYGRLNVDNIKYHNQALIGQTYRKYQNSIRIYHWISNQLTKESQLKII